MKKSYFVSLLIIFLLLCTIDNNVFAYSNKHKFTIPSRGIKYIEVSVPENAKNIKAVISGQTGMIKLALFAPGKKYPASKTSTWSNLSNWRKAISCSKNKPKEGIWRIKIEGAVHVGKLDKIKSVSGYLEIFIDGVSIDYNLSTKKKVHSSSFPIVKKYQFTIPSRGIKYYEIMVPENSKSIKAVISGQTQMVNLRLFAPGKNIPSCKTTTWSYLSSWKKPLKCWKNNPVKAGIWRIEVEGAVHVGKLKKIKSVSGKLTITVEGNS